MLPDSVVMRVSIARVPLRYWRSVANDVVGLIDQCPAPGSRMRAKTAGLSNLGRQSQSTDPRRLTSAAEEQSESRP